jgi:hypothetical protein
LKGYDLFGDQCDRVLCRDENNPTGPLKAKRVLQTFDRTAEVLYLEVHGQTIGTTGEHPFYVPQKGWTEARDLQPGDELITSHGKKLSIESVSGNGEHASVYNCEVEDCHTYYVGETSWQFDVWVHNADVYHYTSLSGVKGMNASRTIKASQTQGKHAELGAVVFVTTKTPAEIAAAGGAKKVLGLTSEKATHVVNLGEIAASKLKPLAGQRGKFIFYVKGNIKLPLKGKIGQASGL